MSDPVPVLLRGLVDDAAVFPPGNATVPDAVAGHAAHRGAWYAGAVGPLLLPASGVAELTEALDAGTWTRLEPLRVGLVARPGTDPAVLAQAVAALGQDERVEVVAAELGWEERWRDLGLDDLPLAVEVGRAGDADAPLADLRRARRAGRRVVAKFRTGPTPTWPWPDERELAGFLRAATALHLPFKLTGGLHHAVRGTYAVDGVPEQNHGVLNVLLATAAALEGASTDEAAALLALTDATALADLVAAWADDTTAAVRAAFGSYGCCTVTDPLGELADLGLLPRPTEGPR